MNVDMNMSVLPQGFMMIVTLAIWAITIIVHICFALAVSEDADSLPDGRKPIFVGRGIWFLATLFGGLFTAAIYWVMHHSRLNESVSVTPTEP